MYSRNIHRYIWRKSFEHFFGLHTIDPRTGGHYITFDISGEKVLNTFSAYILEIHERVVIILLLTSLSSWENLDDETCTFV